MKPIAYGLLAAMTLLSSCSTLPKNYAKVDEIYSRSGQPTVEEISTLKDLGVRTILRLNSGKNSQNYSLETSFCASNGINLIDVPLAVDKFPSKENLLSILSAIKNTNNYPIHVHCGAGADRTGGVTTAHLLEKGVPFPLAKNEGLSERYGHKKFYPFDHVFWQYWFNTGGNLPFAEWVDKRYVPDEKEYSAWTNRLEHTKRFWESRPRLPE